MSSAPSPTSPPNPPAGSTNTTSPPAVTTPPSTSPATPNATAPASTPPAVPSASPPSLPPPVPTTPPPSATPAVPSSPSPPSGNGTTPAIPSSPSPPSGGGSSSGGGGSTTSPPSGGDTSSSSGGGGGSSTPSVQTPPSRSSPPAPTGGSSGSSSSSPGSGGVSTSLVVGVVVGGAVLLILITLLCICCRRRKRSNRPPPGYYGGPPPSRKEEYHGSQAHAWQQNAPPPPSDHVVKIPLPHTSPPPAHASRPPLAPSPPPPPPQYSSSAVSSSNYSGPDGVLPLPPPPPPPSLGGFSKNMFTYEELSIATDGFSDANLLGQGGFGYVHRGMLMNGEEIAVKQLKAGSGQGEREFQAEVEIISRVHHKHLVSLVGYCMTGSKRMLVYEFVPNNTLEFHLHAKGRPTMAWPTRLKIAIGSARGLAYLHEDCQPKIIHRDIKAANILLDFKFEAKVADFGLAKFSSDTNTHVSTRVMGTFGYMAPEYASSGKLTEKSDVFSYGVMLLELITGKRPVDSSLAYMDDSLVDWARPLLTRAIEDKSYEALADPGLQGNYDPNEMARMVASAAACVRHSARRRPRMSQVVRALEGDVSLDDLNDGVRPGHSSVYGSVGSSDYDSGMYREDMKKFRKLALSSQEYPSTEYSEPTSEYGQNPSGSSGENPSREVRRTAKTPNDSRGF